MFLQRLRDCTQCSHYHRNNLHFDLPLIIITINIINFILVGIMDAYCHKIPMVA